MNSELFVVPQKDPADISGLKNLIESGKIDPSKVVAVLGKTEGNGCVNDFTRGYTTHVLKEYFAGLIPHEISSEIVYIMSGGCEGVMSPHLNVFTRSESKSGAAISGGMTVSVARTRDFEPAEIGTMTMVQIVADKVKELIAEMDVDVEDVHFAQIKCPLISSDDIADSKQSGSFLKTTDTLKSMGFSRAASALGIACGLGEIDAATISEQDIGSNFSLYSDCASASAGIELKCCEILIISNHPQSTSSFKAGHSVMKDALDREALIEAARMSQNGSPEPSWETAKAVLAKAEASHDGLILGQRHTMLQDSDISPTRMARSVVAGVIASTTKNPIVYVSGGAEHQGPSGGGPVAVISSV